MGFFKRRFRSLLSINPSSITVLLTLFVLALFLFGVPILDIVELKMYDLRFLSRGALKASPEVVIAVIDEKSLEAEGRWPWPRAKMARLVQALSEDGAKVIALDVGFFEPDENTNLKFIEQFDQRLQTLKIADMEIRSFLTESRKSADNDLLFSKVIAQSEASVVLGYFFHMSQVGLDYTIDQKQMSAQLQRVANSRYPLVIFKDKELMADPFVSAYAPVGNLEVLSEVASGSGYFNMFPDPDGVVRWMPLIIKCGGEIYSPLSIQSVWHYWGKPPLMVRVATYGVEGIRMGSRFIPTDENGQMLINYLGPANTFRHYSISDILARRIPPGSFKDKIVLVGATAVGIYDLRNTPFSPVFPGVEIHANVIDNILRGEFINKPKWARLFDVISIVVLGFLIGFVVPRLGAVKGMVFALMLFTIHVLAAYWLFSHQRIWASMVYPLLTGVLVYICMTVYHYVTEERERKKIRGAFSYYVSGSVVNEMLKNPDKLKLGGDKRDLSVLFSDIRGFTTISEGLTPEELVHLLNEYLTVMTNVVFRHDGTLDKYMGDAIMAVYGAPLDQPDHPHRACRSALDMMEELKKLNQKWIREGKRPLDIGVGINTGMMMVGNMGSEQRFDYTVMGDAVNLGSRLEGANKNYQTNILISEFTQERVKDAFVCMELDSVQVKGKLKPVRIFQLVGGEEVDRTRREAIATFNRGLQMYKQQKWDEAIECFRAAAEMNNDIPAAELYIGRCLDLKENPPGADWNGVFVMKTK